ncbi:MAG TPA: pseudouridine synthase [Candidatus Saccharimonadales bacterium]|nr:pseudouridine synthase [Candidatus Saccharimonadales bacterium]
MRLNHFLAAAGLASRRAADKLITGGQVKVNDQTVTELGTKVDPAADRVVYNGKKITLEEKIVTYLLNKPRGVVTTAHDPDGKRTVLDLVPKLPRVFPCGRLDEETQGLVVLTNDGNLCFQLTHPRFEHEKEYVVHATAKNPAAALEKLRSGVTLTDGPAKADRLTDVTIKGQKVIFTIIIHEGRNRIVRRMSAKAGLEVTSLTRIRVGKYRLGELKPGQWRTI